MENIAELSPHHLVVHGASGRVLGPPCAGVPTQLLYGEEGLLHFGVAQEPELRLHHPKSVISLERLSCLSEERWVSDREVTVGGRRGSGSIYGPIATTSRVGHELTQQFGLLIPGFEDRGDRLSQTWRWRRVPISLGALGPSPSIASVLHSVIQTCYH
jgi:hypothetical protein